MLALIVGIVYMSIKTVILGDEAVWEDVKKAASREKKEVYYRVMRRRLNNYQDKFTWRNRLSKYCFAHDDGWVSLMISYQGFDYRINVR